MIASTTKTRIHRFALLLAGLALVLPGSAFPQAADADAAAAAPPAAEEPAPEPPPAISLDQLLEQVRTGRRAEEKVNKDREAAFRREKRNQEKLLADAKAKRDAEEQRSEQLETNFEQNELKIAELEELLAVRLGTLGELFGVVRQVAGDTRANVENSLVSAQLPGRAAFLEELGQEKALPSLDQLERLWYTLQQEMTESGKVVRFDTEVVDLDGNSREAEVVRIGVFSPVSGGKFLNWENGVLTELARQPADAYIATLVDLENAANGLVRSAIDPARGSLLRVLVEQKTLEEVIQAGGNIGMVIIALGSLTFLLALGRMGYVFMVSRQVKAEQKDPSRGGNNPLGRVLAVYNENKKSDTETLELKLDEVILRETARVESFLWIIKVVAAIAPLLGLLGTVTGMIQTFQMITLFGAGDPKMMADGISVALVTTMLGLCVAIPLVLMHSIVASMSKGISDILEERSAGLVAMQVEGIEGEGEAA